MLFAASCSAFRCRPRTPSPAASSAPAPRGAPRRCAGASPERRDRLGHHHPRLGDGRGVVLLADQRLFPARARSRSRSSPCWHSSAAPSGAGSSPQGAAARGSTVGRRTCRGRRPTSTDLPVFLSAGGEARERAHGGADDHRTRHRRACRCRADARAGAGLVRGQQRCRAISAGLERMAELLADAFAALPASSA